jgi:hypothetical protein
VKYRPNERFEDVATDVHQQQVVMVVGERDQHVEQRNLYLFASVKSYINKMWIK